MDGSLCPSGSGLVGAREDVPDVPEPCTSRQPTVCTLVSGSGPHVLLAGDSQARMFVPAFVRLAQGHDLRLSVNVVPGCPWQRGLRNTRVAPEQEQQCREAHEGFYQDVLPTLGVDVVVAMTLSRSARLWERDLVLRDEESDTSQDSSQNSLRDGLREGSRDVGGAGVDGGLRARVELTSDQTVRTIRDSGAELVLVKSLLGTEGFDIFGFDPIECLAQAEVLGECAVYPPLQRPWVDGLYERLARVDSGVHTVDLNPVLCVRGPVCAPVVNDAVVWRDAAHVTSSFLAERHDELWVRLSQLIGAA